MMINNGLGLQKYNPTNIGTPMIQIFGVIAPTM